MGLNFVKENLVIGNINNLKGPFTFYKNGWVLDNSKAPFIFYKNGWVLNNYNHSTVSWRDMILSGVGALTLADAKNNSLNYLKLYGGCEQNGTPTPTTPVDIYCNNGAIKISPNLANYISSNVTLGYYVNISNGAVTQQSNNFMSNYIPVKASTKYVAYGKKTSGGTYSTYNRIAWYDSNQDFISGISFSNSAPAIGTSPSNAAYAIFNSNPESKTTTQTLLDSYDWVFQEGSTDPITFMPFGQMYIDGTTETVKVHGTNIFNLLTDDTGQGWYINSDAVANAGSSNRTIVIDCKPNTYYSWWHAEGIGGCRAFCLSADTIEVGQSATWTTPSSPPYTSANVVTTVQTPANAKKLYICAGHRDSSSTRTFEDQLADLMVVEGQVSVATAYKANYSGGTVTAEYLWGIDEDTDMQEVLSGTVTRNIKYRIFDGTESFSSSTAYGQALLVSAASSTWGANRTKAVLCTHFAGKPTATSNQPLYSCFFNSTGHFYFRTEETATNFKAWLAEMYAAGTPLIVLFVKAAPTTESVSGQSLTIQAGTNVVEIAQAGIESLSLDVSYKGISS